MILRARFYRRALQVVLSIIGTFSMTHAAICRAQVSDLDGGRWILVNFHLHPNGSLQHWRHAAEIRRVTNLEISLRNPGIQSRFLNLNPLGKKKVQTLLDEYDAAFKDRTQGFIFDFRNQDYEIYQIQSAAWHKSWRAKLEQALEPAALVQLDQATIRWMLGSLTLEGFMQLYFGHESFLGMSDKQQRDFSLLLRDWRKRVLEHNRDSYQDHLTEVSMVLTAAQKTTYERDFAAYVNQLQPPVELLIFQMTLNESSELVKDKLQENPEVPDNWLSLPVVFDLGINGEIRVDPNSGLPPGKQKINILKEVYMNDVMELSTDQMDQLAGLKLRLDAEIAELNVEYNQKVKDARRLHGWDGNDPYPRADEIKIITEMYDATMQKQARLDRQLARDIDQVLVPKQIEFLDVLAARSEVRVFGILNALRSGRLGKRLEINARQCELLAKIQETSLQELRKNAKRIEDEFFDAWRAMLTEEQRKELTNLIGPEHPFFQPHPSLLIMEASRLGI
jgi:hypothetical protein